MRKKAIEKVFIDNSRTRVAEWSFEPGSETGWHQHKYDYVVVPLLDGVLELETSQNFKTLSDLKEGIPYFRKAGVAHNVINANKSNFKFMEIEIK